MNKGITKEELNKFINVLEEIQSSPNALDFINPVDFVGKKLSYLFFNSNLIYRARIG